MASTFDPPRPWTASYGVGVPDDLEPVTGSIVDLLIDTAHEHPDAPATEFFGRTTTYFELLELVERAAGALLDLGVVPGSRVAIGLPNSPQHVIAFYAVQRLGGVVIEHNPLYRPEELEHLFRDHRARVAIVWDKIAGSIQAMDPEVQPEVLISVNLTRAMPLTTRLALMLPLPQARKSLEALTTTVSNTLHWYSLLRHAPVASTFPKPGTDDLAVIQYTSGTTGVAKGVELTHRNLLSNARQCVLWGVDVPHGVGTSVYGVLPMFHAYGLTLCLTVSVSLAARLVLFPKFDPELVLDAMRKHPATLFPLVPPIASRLLSKAKERGQSLAGTGIAISGAMPLPPNVIEPFEQDSGGYLLEGYGLSECAPILMINPFNDDRTPGAVGLPVPGTEVRIVDPENPSIDMPQGQRGELLARGPQVFRGYFNRPEETAQAFHDGWFRTGDIAIMDERGFVRIVDRIKELIITGGFNVMPSEVEDVLRQHPHVTDAAVVGLPHPHSGEEVVAAVTVVVGITLDIAELRSFARERLTPYKVPRRVDVVDSLPLSQLGKVMRRKVREALLADQHELVGQGEEAAEPLPTVPQDEDGTQAAPSSTPS